MSKAALEAIQAKLKTAIQSHQILVAKMKSDPQNQAYKKQLHDLQTEITSLDDRQKVVVQKLRKELVSKQQNAFQQPQTTTPNTVTMTNCTSQLRLQPTDLSKKNEGVKSPSILNTPNTKAYLAPNHSPRSISPPIRVPHYTVSKPTLLQGAKPSLLPNNKTQMAPPNVVPPRRTFSDSDIGDIRKTVERKQLSVEEKKKMEFMASIDLVTPDTLKELQNKRSERKRRSTANPQFSYNFETDRKRMTSYLVSSLTPGTKRPRGRPPKHGASPNSSRPGTPDSSDSGASYKNGVVTNGSAEGEIHDGLCLVCQKAGRLLVCDSCGMAYHPACVDPPVSSPPSGPWRCNKCQNDKSLSAGSDTLAIVHTYIANKTAKEEERKKLQRRSAELSNERVQLESKSKQLSETLYQHIQQKQELIESNRATQQSAEDIKNFIQSIKSCD